jgi:hypothetical protein
MHAIPAYFDKDGIPVFRHPDALKELVDIPDQNLNSIYSLFMYE